MGGSRPALSARVAKERNRISGQIWTEGEERTFSDPAEKAKVQKLEAWEHFRVFSPVQPGAQHKDLVDTRWALTWKEVDGVKTVAARLVAEGY